MADISVPDNIPRVRRPLLYGENCLNAESIFHSIGRCVVARVVGTGDLVHYGPEAFWCLLRVCVCWRRSTRLGELGLTEWMMLSR